VIRGNTIRDGNFDGSIAGYNAGDISVHVMRIDGRNGLSRAISQVEILNNTIINTGRRAISVASATDVTIAGNLIRCQDPTAPVFQDGAVTPIRLCDVDRVTTRGNTIIEPRLLTPGCIAIEGKCTAVDLRDNQIVQNAEP
jgi:hypothetical protein